MFAVAAIVAMLAVAEGAKRETMEQIAQLGTNSIIIRRALLTEAQEIAARTRLSQGLNRSDVSLLERGIPTASYVAPLKEVRAAVSSSSREGGLEVLAVTASYQPVKSLEMRQGRFIQGADVDRRHLVCALGAQAAGLLGIEGRVGGVLRIEDYTYRVVGVLKERQWVQGKGSALAVRNYNRVVFIPLGAEPEVIHPQGEFGELSEISIQVRQGSSVEATAAVAGRILVQNHGGVEDFHITIPEVLLRQAQRTQRVFNLVLGCIAGILLLVGGVSITSTMLASVSERTREIGIRRSIGASQRHIVAQFLAESAPLTAAGGSAGLALGGVGASTISALAGWRTAVTLWSLVLAIAMAVGVGLLSGLYPAVRAARLDPIAALRHA